MEDETKKKRGRPKKEKAEKVEAEMVSDGSKKSGVGVNGNLITFEHLSESRQREIRSAGGKASVAKKRAKKELREFTKDFLMQDAAGVLKQNMSVLGVDAEQMTNLAAMVIRLFSKAVNQGDLNAARTIIEWAGMAPLQQENENAAIARMSQVIQLAEGNNGDDNEVEDVVFYIPNNNRPVAADVKSEE